MNKLEQAIRDYVLVYRSNVVNETFEVKFAGDIYAKLTLVVDYNKEDYIFDNTSATDIKFISLSDGDVTSKIKGALYFSAIEEWMSGEICKQYKIEKREKAADKTLKKEAKKIEKAYGEVKNNSDFGFCFEELQEAIEDDSVDELIQAIFDEEELPYWSTNGETWVRSERDLKDLKIGDTVYEKQGSSIKEYVIELR